MADYAHYLIPSLNRDRQILFWRSACARLATWLLYRDIRSIGKISAVLWGGLMAAIAIIIYGGATPFQSGDRVRVSDRRFQADRRLFCRAGRGRADQFLRFQRLLQRLPDWRRDQEAGA